MEDFTGGLTERFDLNKPPANLLQIMLKGFERGSLMGCALDVSNSSHLKVTLKYLLNSKLKFARIVTTSNNKDLFDSLRQHISHVYFGKNVVNNLPTTLR